VALRLRRLRNPHYATRTTSVIVADADLIAYFWIEQVRSEAARRVRRRDAAWAVPRLWRSEFRAILRGHMETGLMTHEEARGFTEQAGADLGGAEHDVSDAGALRLVAETNCSAYDAEYLALAQALDVGLVTGRRALAKAFPQTAVVMEDFADGDG
jgi:predicted nucleic acid-binding protein